jgi:hypothetical protein
MFIEALNEKRMKHCQLIVRGVVFAFFGHADTKEICSDTVEYQDLNEPDPKFNFTLLPIKGYQTYAVEPMVFPEEICDND